LTDLIELRHVTKRYRSWTGREVLALEDLSLDLRAGEVFGLAGPNGAGKSTLISLLLGFFGPTHGEVRIGGVEPRRYVERHGIGYLSELINVPPAWRVTSALRRYALLAGVPANALDTRVGSLLTLLGLEDHAGKRVRQLSKGNLQRLGLAQALLGEEHVIVLDEPTHGLDPVWTQRFRDVVVELRRPKRIIVIASHNLDELSRLADRVGIIDHGRLQRVVDMRAPGELARVEAPYRIVLNRGKERVTEIFPGAREIDSARGEFELPPLSLEKLNAGLARLIAAGVIVSAVYPVHSALEQQFREAVGVTESQTERGR
jgi:ABC-type multidrug transport system ATPase subunit